MEFCVLCKQNLHSGEKTVVPTERGLATLLWAINERGDEIDINPGQAVHEHCRRTYTNKRCISSYLKKIEKDRTTNVSERLRSQKQEFDFKKCCLFCGHQAETASNIGPATWAVRTIEFKDSILKSCEERGNDEWAGKVRGRIESVSDLPAADAIYHQTCSTNFRTKRKLPQLFTSEHKQKKTKSGRPVDTVRADAFLNVTSFLRENDEQLTVNDLIDHMKEHSGGETYSFKKMKTELQKHFGDQLIFTEIGGKTSVATLRKTASAILHEFYSMPPSDDEDSQKECIIKAAADLIKSDIKNVAVSRDQYPSPDDVASPSKNLEFVPLSLRLLLNNIFSGKNNDLKIASIGQAIMQAARPRLLIAPLQIGLAVQMHHCFESQFLVDILNSLGYGATYKEVRTYEVNAAASQDLTVPITDGHFMQYMADNVDHNTATIDGLRTFHGMGMIASVTPRICNRIPVSRNKDVKLEDVIKRSKIDIRYYKQESDGLQSLKFDKLFTKFIKDPSKEIDILWKASWLLNPKRPSWSGVMQTVHCGDYPGQSSVLFLPMIDLNPSDTTCIYSTLLFISKEAKRHNKTPVVTFDQPLWWKALRIIESEPKTSELKAVLLRLGPFHMEMSYLSCIGHLMDGTGLSDILSLIYAPNAVSAMLQGKAVTRAVRGHFIIDAALNALLFSKTLGVPLPECNENENEIPSQTQQQDGTSDQVVDVAVSNEVTQGDCPSETYSQDVSKATCGSLVTDTDLHNASSLFEELISGNLSVAEVKDNETVLCLNRKVQNQAALLESRTSRLWLQYMTMIDILKRFIKAERTGNWLLHLSAVQEMLPYLAAAGHHFYTKSAYLYLQAMNKLEETHPDIYNSFIQGHHVIRRSNRYWAGISSDLAIEQVLMRSIKSTGGLTRGRGIGESQRATWILSMPACAEINNAMQEVTETLRLSSEQHKDIGFSRTEKDSHDMMVVTKFLKERNPFVEDDALRNIVTGVVADHTVNVDKAQDVGFVFLNKMEGQSVSDVSMKKKDKAVTMNKDTSVRTDQDTITVDPQLLFQRLVAAANSKYEEKSEIFQYELCSYPSSLFESAEVLQQPNKYHLAEELWKLLDMKVTDIPPSPTLQFIVDGGSLLHRIPWHRGDTFDSIIESYVLFASSHYTKAVIVFDGYQSGPSTKDMTHRRRAKGIKGHAVHFSSDMRLQFSKDHFLANKENKQRFINALGSALEERGHIVCHSKGDADLTIVMTAVEYAKHQDTAVVGEDTDLLILLAHHADENSHNIYFYSDKQLPSSKKKLWNIKELINKLGEKRHLLLFLHAITGCDTTSRPFGIGKATSLKRLLKNETIRCIAKDFMAEHSSQEISTLGEKALVLLYNGNPDENLNGLRHRLFCIKVATGTTFVQAHSLPPTSAAAAFHSLRVYLQIQQWMGNDALTPTDWGWRLEHGQYIPLMTILPAAPPELIKIIRCTCKENCDTRRCTCRKHGLECSQACTDCRGISCLNAQTICLEEGRI